MTVKVVESYQNPTHRFFRDGRYIYIVANGKIDVAETCNVSVKDIWVNNAGKWENEDETQA